MQAAFLKELQQKLQKNKQRMDPTQLDQSSNSQSKQINPINNTIKKDIPSIGANKEGFSKNKALLENVFGKSKPAEEKKENIENAVSIQISSMMTPPPPPPPPPPPAKPLTQTQKSAPPKPIVGSKNQEQKLLAKPVHLPLKNPPKPEKKISMAPHPSAIQSKPIPKKIDETPKSELVNQKKQTLENLFKKKEQSSETKKDTLSNVQSISIASGLSPPPPPPPPPKPSTQPQKSPPQKPPLKPQRNQQIEQKSPLKPISQPIHIPLKNQPSPLKPEKNIAIAPHPSALRSKPIPKKIDETPKSELVNQKKQALENLFKKKEQPSETKKDTLSNVQSISIASGLPPPPPPPPPGKSLPTMQSSSTPINQISPKKINDLATSNSTSPMKPTPQNEEKNYSPKNKLPIKQKVSKSQSQMVSIIPHEQLLNKEEKKQSRDDLQKVSVHVSKRDSELYQIKEEEDKDKIIQLIPPKFDHLKDEIKKQFRIDRGEILEEEFLLDCEINSLIEICDPAVEIHHFNSVLKHKSRLNEQVKLISIIIF